MIRLSQTYFSAEHDMTVYLEYQENNQISGVNFLMGKVTPEEVSKPDPFISHFVLSMWDTIVVDTKQTQDEMIIIQILELYSKLALYDWNFKDKTYEL